MIITNIFNVRHAHLILKDFFGLDDTDASAMEELEQEGLSPDWAGREGCWEEGFDLGLGSATAARQSSAVKSGLIERIFLKYRRYSFAVFGKLSSVTVHHALRSFPALFRLGSLTKHFRKLRLCLTELRQLSLAAGTKRRCRPTKLYTSSKTRRSSGALAMATAMRAAYVGVGKLIGSIFSATLWVMTSEEWEREIKEGDRQRQGERGRKVGRER